MSAQNIISVAEREARVQLAALHRLVELQGWGEGIYNHIALRVPDDHEHFLIKPHGLRYDEITASSLIKVDCRGDLDESAGVNSVGFNTHAPIIRERRDVDCSIHLHTVPVMAVAAMTELILALTTKAFVDEDKPMLEAQQQRVGEADFWSLKPLLLPIDKAAVLARRKIEKLIAAENGGG